MSTKLLNLDDLIEDERAIRIKGVEYTIADQSVGQMLSAIKASNRTEDHDDPEFVVTTMIKHVQQIIPDCPIEVIESLGMSGITAILAFVSGAPAEKDGEDGEAGNELSETTEK